MSSNSRVLTRLEEQLPEDTKFDANDIMADENYTKKLSQLIHDSLKKGCDVMQLPSGDVVITEIKTVTYQYNWDSNKSRFERAKSGTRSKRRVVVAGNSNATTQNKAPATEKQRVLEEEMA